MFLIDWLKSVYHFITPELHEGDTRDGKGILYHKNGNIKYTGYWKDSTYHGQGKLYNYDGLVQYDGAFVNGYYHGQGTYCAEFGKPVYVGGFNMGKPDGKGVAYQPLTKYKATEGTYEHGFIVEGRKFDSDGEIIFEGTFKHGLPHKGQLYIDNDIMLEGTVNSANPEKTVGPGYLYTIDGQKFRTMDGIPYGDDLNKN